MITLDWKLYVFLLSLNASLLLGLEVNGLYMFFGLSVFVGAGLLIALCQIYIWRFMKKTTVLMFTSGLLSVATISFASLDVVSHWRNASGYNTKIAFEVEETDRKLKSYLDEIKSLEVEQRRLPASFGSPTKRQQAREQINKRKDFVNQEIEKITQEKRALLNKTSSDTADVVAKLGMIVLLQLVFLVLLSNSPKKYKAEPSKPKETNKDTQSLSQVVSEVLLNPTTEDPIYAAQEKPTVEETNLKTSRQEPLITKQEISLLESILKNPPDKKIRYPFAPDGREALYKRALEHGLVFDVEGRQYTHSLELANYKKQ